MEIVISVTVQERQQHTVYTYTICKNFILVCVSNYTIIKFYVILTVHHR